MKTYEIEIEEVMQRRVQIDAENEKEAIKQVKERYKNEEIVLDYGDFKDVSFKNVLLHGDTVAIVDNRRIKL